MESEYAHFLENEVVELNKIVTYRALSRALKVHVNQAKEMLYAYHTTYNAKATSTNPPIHASYILTGYRRVAPTPSLDDDGDEHMHSSQFGEKPQEEERMQKTVVVVAEDKLDEAKATFARLSSIAVYSLQPAKLSDLHLIAGAAQEFLAEYRDEDKGAMCNVYGNISNAFAKKCSAKIAPPPAVRPPPKTVTPAPIKEEPKKQPSIFDMCGPKGLKAKSSTREKAPPVVVSAAAKKTQKDFFGQSASAKPKKAAESTPPAPPTEPTPMKMDTDSEGEDQAPVAPVRDTADDSRKRKAKQAALEAMMDSDSDSAPPEKKSVPSPHPNQPPPSAQPAPSRSRGKRKVKKKVTSKDADGYLNTRYEDTWESCSDEEPAPPPPPEAKTKPMVVGKKGKGQLKGQGTLTSFFKRPT